MKKPLVLGLDLGGTKIAAGVVDSGGRLLSSVRLPTPASGVKRDLAALFDAARAAVAAAKVSWRRIRAIGVGVPGAFDPKSETVWAPNLPGWKRVPLKRLLEKTLAKPVFIEGDRNVQALAEAWLASGRGGVRNLVFLTVGTGIGAGIIADGRVVTGAHGVAGAAGWLAVSEHWRSLYGNVGCLEALGAGPAVGRIAKQLMRSKGGVLIRKLASAQGGRIGGEAVAAAARRGDRVARQVLEQVGSNLGLGVADIISLLNPDVVILGGGLAGAGELILKPLRRAARHWAQPLAFRQARIVRSKLGEDAGVLGAARYAMLNMSGR